MLPEMYTRHIYGKKIVVPRRRANELFYWLIEHPSAPEDALAAGDHAMLPEINGSTRVIPTKNVPNRRTVLLADRAPRDAPQVMPQVMMSANYGAACWYVRTPVPPPTSSTTTAHNRAVLAPARPPSLNFRERASQPVTAVPCLRATRVPRQSGRALAQPPSTSRRHRSQGSHTVG